MSWTPESWKARPVAQAVSYPDERRLAEVVERLRELPPLVTSWEIETLKGLLAEAQQGKRLLLQGGDCAETIADCRPDVITGKLKILLQMSLVLVVGAQIPVVRVGRFAGQYAKPRSSPTEKTRDASGREVTLQSYFGDLVNRSEPDEAARTPDPALLLAGYHHAAVTLNFVRSLSAGGFADLHHPEYWDLPFLENATLAPESRTAYGRIRDELETALRFMMAIGEKPLDELSRVSFFTSHEGLNLHYESAQTRAVPRRDGYWDLTTHLPWIGERTRQLDGAHVEHFRGVKNPIGLKIGPTVTPDALVQLVDALNPTDEPGKLVLVTRLGARDVAALLPPLVERVKREGRTVLWVTDPMHGNTTAAASGRKTRRYDDILAEVRATMDVHEALGTVFGGVHFELTAEDVTECTGGAGGVTEDDLERNYATACDPRLNYAQALEMAFAIAEKLRARR